MAGQRGLRLLNRQAMLQDIQRHIELAEQAIAWAKTYGKNSFPFEKFKDYRRKLKKIGSALEENCSAAAYGESQVGKSYLMSGLLSSASSPFMITHGGKSYSFIDELNPSGGNNSKVESTGVVTRFTLSSGSDNMKEFVKVRNLSVVDIILLLANSYYNDIKIDQDRVLKYEQINQCLGELSSLWSAREVKHSVICEDDIKDIADYIKDVIGNPAAMVNQSNFCRVVSPVIQYVPYDKWVDIFSLLWNKNEEISHLFNVLISEYKKIDFRTDVYIPFSAVLREKGTILKIQWLDTVCGAQVDMGNDELVTDIYAPDGSVIARGFGKGYLSALIAEITLELPAQIADERPFLKKMDLLDFPGARGKEEYSEAKIHDVLHTLLRRGKVAYLFNKYSRSLRIGSVLFCFHNDQKAAPIGGTINSWIEDNIGSTPAERAKMLSDTNGIAPLFLVATKFNIDLERAKTDKQSNRENLAEHWKRFKDVLPEIIKPSRWLNDWVPASSGRPAAFQNIYPLRDFYWSKKNEVFDGYEEGKAEETSVHHFEDYPDYFDSLRDSFLQNEFVKTHFADPQKSWDEVATPGNDGSKAIIRNLNGIAAVLDNARQNKYLAQLKAIKDEMHRTLSPYFEPEAQDDKNKKVKEIVSDIKMSLMLRIGSKPEIFGKIIDTLMVPVGDLRSIAYDIIVCKSETPAQFDQVKFIRKMANVDSSDSKDVCIAKLCKCFSCDEADLQKKLQDNGCSLEDLVLNNQDIATTVSEVVVRRIVEYWREYMNRQVKLLNELIPHAEEIVFKLATLFDQLNVRRELSDRIDVYCTTFREEEQPNAVADYASLVLNNFVSNVGREHISDQDLADVSAKAEKCGIEIDARLVAREQERQARPLLETLEAFDKATKVETTAKDDLMKLPFWGSFERWKNLLTIGLLFTSDISNVDPEANAKVKELIDGCESLYLK